MQDAKVRFYKLSRLLSMQVHIKASFDVPPTTSQLRLDQVGCDRPGPPAC